MCVCERRECNFFPMQSARAHRRKATQKRTHNAPVWRARRSQAAVCWEAAMVWVVSRARERADPCASASPPVRLLRFSFLRRDCEARLGAARPCSQLTFVGCTLRRRFPLFLAGSVRQPKLSHGVRCHPARQPGGGCGLMRRLSAWARSCGAACPGRPHAADFLACSSPA